MQDFVNQLSMNEHSSHSVIGTVDDVHQRLLDKVRYLDLELRAVSIGLKSKLEKTYLIRDQMTQCVESLPIGVILVDQEGRIQRVNKVARTLCGWDSHASDGKYLKTMWTQLGWASCALYEPTR